MKSPSSELAADQYSYWCSTEHLQTSCNTGGLGAAWQRAETWAGLQTWSSQQLLVAVQTSRHHFCFYFGTVLVSCKDLHLVVLPPA